MTAGNRKYKIQHSISRPEPKPSNGAAIFVGILAIIAIVGIVLGSTIVRASAAPVKNGCESRGTVAGFGYVDSGKFTIPEEGMEFEDFKCVKGGNQVWITKADTYVESYDLEQWARSGWKHVGLMCFSPGGKMAYISSVDEISGFNLNDRQIAKYEQWALKYADKKGCEVVR